MVQQNKPLITIVGVLGKQGRSVAHTLLASGRYRVRGITRRTDSPEARALAAQGMELVRIPLAPGYQEAFENAFRGSDGVFLVTPNIVPPANYEFGLGKELADAAVDAGVRHIIFSSLENVDKNQRRNNVCTPFYGQGQDRRVHTDLTGREYIYTYGFLLHQPD